MSAPNPIVGLGGRTDHIATVPHLDPARLHLSPEEGSVLALVGRVERIDAVLSRSSLGEARTIAVLLSLRAKGAIVPARVVQRATPAAPSLDAAMAEEVDLEPEQKREIIDLERSLDGMDHHAVLGVPRGATAQEVKQAYYNASRRFHPDRYFGKNLGSFRARLERIFKRLTDAHNALSRQEPPRPPAAAPPQAAPPPQAARPAPPAPPVPGRRPTAESFAAVTPPPPAEPPPPAPEDPESEARRAERQARFARHPYMARSHKLTELIARGKAATARGDFERAYQDFNHVLGLDPKNREVASLLVDARRKHDLHRAQTEVERGQELEMRGDFSGAQAAYKLAVSLNGDHPEASYQAARVGRELAQDPQEVRALAQRAVELKPGRADYQLLLAQVLLVAGQKKQAKHHFEEAVRLDPDNAEARAALKKLRWTFS
ncbi:tetratricopeptide repeat protein [Corallococcus sp. Z5C101001]|uniref:tetratricopeptide repeat protein n=1 Tax=Corallococcus sp. Z5C101001 TaxID=2596829 RepID=UPI00117E4B10|nr:tetratricopeptide repeat protein [Corallococcus sp. Z5C101001]NBD10962.1 tetratricopeptide repeat protein [Corallococcus silvisoli]TSC31604.1 tetratricopeptide repeat protein [Corallococcus sp. Z5C101001]